VAKGRLEVHLEDKKEDARLILKILLQQMGFGNMNWIKEAQHRSW
jgi:hypothetical protein